MDRRRLVPCNEKVIVAELKEYTKYQGIKSCNPTLYALFLIVRKLLMCFLFLTLSRIRLMAQSLDALSLGDVENRDNGQDAKNNDDRYPKEEIQPFGYQLAFLHRRQIPALKQTDTVLRVGFAFLFARLVAMMMPFATLRGTASRRTAIRRTAAVVMMFFTIRRAAVVVMVVFSATARAMVMMVSVLVLAVCCSGIIGTHYFRFEFYYKLNIINDTREFFILKPCKVNESC